jgi:hypothetical protein
MPQQPRQNRYNTNTSVDTRLSRLETIIESISSSLDKIQTKLDYESKINWTPIGIGITVFFTVVGSFATIYTARMNGTDSNIKALTEQTQALAVASTEQRIALQTMTDRQNDFKNYTTQRIDDLEKRIDEKLKKD